MCSAYRSVHCISENAKFTYIIFIIGDLRYSLWNFSSYQSDVDPTVYRVEIQLYYFLRKWLIGQKISTWQKYRFNSDIQILVEQAVA